MRFGLYRTISRYTGQASLIATAQAVAINGRLTIGHAMVAPVARRAAQYWGVVAADLFFAAGWCQSGHVPVLADGV